VGAAALTEGATALARASKTCDIPVMQALLDGGADATVALANRTTTAMIAAGGNAPEPKVLEAVTLLVEHGVDVNAFNANGQTILHNAAQRGQNSVIEYVARKGAARSARQAGARRSTSRWAPLANAPPGPCRAAAVVNEKTAALLRDLMARP
jgi:ankyrin repeat protein